MTPPAESTLLPKALTMAGGRPGYGTLYPTGHLLGPSCVGLHRPCKNPGPQGTGSRRPSVAIASGDIVDCETPVRGRRGKWWASVPGCAGNRWAAWAFMMSTVSACVRPFATSIGGESSFGLGFGLVLGPGGVVLRDILENELLGAKPLVFVYLVPL